MFKEFLNSYNFDLFVIIVTLFTLFFLHKKNKKEEDNNKNNKFYILLIPITSYIFKYFYLKNINVESNIITLNNTKTSSIMSSEYPVLSTNTEFT